MSSTAAPVVPPAAPPSREAPPSSPARTLTFAALALFTLSPWASPGLALALGAGFALTLGNPLPRQTARWSKRLLQASVVGLGFGIPLAAVAAAGARGVGYTIAGIAVTMVLGVAMGRWLRVERDASVLITAGTGICGGSAIAAVGPAIGAGAEAMSVALATVFVLNAVALYVFPVVGHWVGLSEGQFAIWAAIAIHDTSSVVGAAASYGPRALQDATVLKLARALWIVPLTFGAALLARRWRAKEGGVDAAGAKTKVSIPWFIAFFLLAALVRSALPQAEALFDAVAHAARIALVLTLFLIGAGLSRATLRAVGARPLVQGVLLWIVVATLTLAAVWRWAPA